MNLPFTFPVPLDVFVGYQESLIGRPLSERERALVALWMPIVNEAELEDLPVMDELIAKHPGNDEITHFLAAVKIWMKMRIDAKEGT